MDKGIKTHETWTVWTVIAAVVTEFANPSIVVQQTAIIAACATAATVYVARNWAKSKAVTK